MKRIQLVLAALAVVVAALAALAGPAMAQVYQYEQNWGNQEGWENGYYVNPDYDYCDYYPWDPYCWGYYYGDDDDPWDYDDGLYVSGDNDGDGIPDTVFYSSDGWD